MLLVSFFVGTILGSFLCLVAERVPKKLSIVTPGSHCPFCHQRLNFFELIPLFSILFQQFRCRHCHSKLSSVYFWGELVSGLFFMIIFSKGISLHTTYDLLLLVMTFLLSVTDIYYLRVEPKLFYPFFLVICFVHFHLKFPFHFIPSFFVFISLSLVNVFLDDSLGGGDILLITALGILLEVELLLRLLLIASSSGILFILFSTLLLKNTIRQLPFVPFLTLGLFIVLCV